MICRGRKNARGMQEKRSSFELILKVGREQSVFYWAIWLFALVPGKKYLNDKWEHYNHHRTEEHKLSLYE